MIDLKSRSHWGWGHAARFPEASVRRQLASHAQALLGFSGLESAEPIALDDIELPTPRVTAPPALSRCSSEALDRVHHTYGQSYPDLVRRFYGDYSGAPDIVAYPETEEDICAILSWASEASICVVPYGGGTSVVGGVAPEGDERRQGVVVVDLRRMDRVLEVDTLSRAARAQAGATTPRLNEQLAEHGVQLRHFPQSYEFATLGGYIATRSGGHYATLYTHIDDFIESIRVVTPAGIMESRRLPGSGAGPSPDRLILGSEGVLGIISEAWFRVQERPEQRVSASVFFERFVDAVSACRQLAQSGLNPSNCRLLDAREAALNQVAQGGENVLALGFEASGRDLTPWIDEALKITAGAGGRCPKGPRLRDSSAASGDAAGTWRKAFFEAPYLRNTLVSMGLIADTFETACTWDRFEELHADLISNLRAEMKRVCGGGRISCRFTHVYPDGPAPYYTFIAPGRRGDELAQWERIKAVAGDTLMEHGATITHHHAVGRMHRRWYQQQRPELFAASLRAMKAVVDPDAIMNPGVLV